MRRICPRRSGRTWRERNVEPPQPGKANDERRQSLGASRSCRPMERSAKRPQFSIAKLPRQSRCVARCLRVSSSSGSSPSGGWPSRGLSRVKGNFHARFLGGCGRVNRPRLPDSTKPARQKAISSVGAVVLQWSSVSKKAYRVQRALTPLRTGALMLTNNVAPTPPVNTFTDTAATNATAFYWIEVQ